VRDFQHKLRLPIHFYTGWEFFLFLLCPLRFRYDWRCQRFSRFPDAHTNSNGHTNSHSYRNRNANWDTNSYSECHRNANGHSECHCHCNGDRHTKRNSTYANAAASPDTSSSSDVSASLVGRAFRMTRALRML